MSHDKEEKYRILFEDSPISLWEEDFSEVKSYIDNLIDNGIKDLKTYLDEHPEEVRKLVTLVKIVEINNTTLSMYGAKDKKDFYEGLDAFFGKESFEDFKEEIVTFVNGNSVFEKEVTNYKLTGEKMNILMKSTIVPGCEETFSRILVSIIDISEMKKVERELQREKDLKELLLDNLPCTAFILNNKTKIIASSNKSALERGTVVGEFCYKTFADKSEPCPWCLSSKACESGKEKRLEVELRDRIWDIYWIPIDEDLLIHFAFDITDRIQIKKALQESEERLDHALKGGGLGIWDHDVLKGEIVRDERTAQIYGYPLEEIESNIHWWEERVHPEDRPEALSILAQCLDGKSTFFEAEYRFKLLSGEWRWILSRGKAVEHDDDGRTVRITGTTRDITDQKAAEKLKEELEKRRENFIWMTSHELRTPLTIVSGYFELLERDMQKNDSDKQQTIFSIIRRNLKRFESLIDRVSSSIQLEKDLFEIDIKEIDVIGFLESIVESYKHILGDQLQFNKPSTMISPRINGDRNGLQQVMENIIGNAIKQTSSKPREIIITLKDFSKTIQIEVSDNGAGIAKENLEKIFEQFISIHTDYSVTGTGLGLFISRRVLEAHGGSIVAQSEGVGNGSTFIITLPRII